jgi:hypothetical protein
MNYFYDLPSDLQEIINQKVNDYYHQQHKKMMEDTFDTIHTARYNVEFEFEGFMEQMEELEDEFEETEAEHGWSKAMVIWLADSYLSETAADKETEGSSLLEQMENKINIKYEDQISKHHDGTEFILFIKDNIKHYDDEKNGGDPVIFDYRSAVNYMDMPNPI